MREFQVLKIVDFFRPLFEKFSIDYPLLRNMIAVKLLMDERRVQSLFGGTKEKDRNPFVNSLWIYALYGLIMVLFVFGEAYMLQMSIMFGVALFVLMTSLIADFSPVMLDTRDSAIMGTKPIDQRTLGIAKFIHILIYLILLTGAFTIIPILLMLFVQGITFTVLFIFMLVLFVLFIITFTSLIYIFVLKLFNDEQLKNIINYIQIIFAIGIIIGYQIIIRTYGYIDSHIAYVFKWWHAILPPYWFAAPFELVMNQNFSIEVIILSLCSFVIPLMIIFLYYRLIPTFETNLQKLLATTDNQAKRGLSLEGLWKKLLCRTTETGIYFQFVFRIVDRERMFKLKVYPSLGIGLVIPFIFLISMVGIVTLEEIAVSNLYFYIYLMHIFIGIALYTFQYSESFKGAWVFNMSDKDVSIPLHKAVMKVFLVRLYLPMFLPVGIGYYLIFTSLHFIDLMIVFVSAVIQALFSYKLIVKSDFPFSLPFGMLTEEGDTTKSLLLMLLVIPFVVFHYMSTLVQFGTYAYFLVLVVAAILLWKFFLTKIKWIR